MPEHDPVLAAKHAVPIQASTAHGDKLDALLRNNKLPNGDRPKAEEAIHRYQQWKNILRHVGGSPEEILQQMVSSLNDYKRFIELDFIFDSQDDFLYRQKGQLKLDNTILEEFLPFLFDVRLVPGFRRLGDIECGPKNSFAGLSFDSPFLPLTSGGVYIKKKNQDFSVSKQHDISVSSTANARDRFSQTVSVSYFATEIKTNLDKTMFQEASQTANELKQAVSGSKYILLCEWLDMTPINTKLTPIDEVIVLRKAKRLPSNVRSNYSTRAGRGAHRDQYQQFLDQNPLSIDCFNRFLFHLNECFPDEAHDADEVVLDRGYF